MLEETIAQQRVAGFSLKYVGQITGSVEVKICLVFKVVAMSLLCLWEFQ